MAVQEDTKERKYTNVLINRSLKNWKLLLDVQMPYRWNINRLGLGKVLDVGCGIGRNLQNLSPDSVGIDHNEFSIQVAKKSNLNAYTVEDFIKNKSINKKNNFDSMLLTHVLEHMPTKEGINIIKQYLPLIKSRVVVICPQEKGFTTDETHVNFLNHEDIENILIECGLKIEKSYSFPFPKIFGKFFTYNETVVIGKK